MTESYISQVIRFPAREIKDCDKKSDWNNTKMIIIYVKVTYGNNFSCKLLLTDRQIASLLQAFAIAY